MDFLVVHDVVFFPTYTLNLLTNETQRGTQCEIIFNQRWFNSTTLKQRRYECETVCPIGFCSMCLSTITREWTINLCGLRLLFCKLLRLT